MLQKTPSHFNITMLVLQDIHYALKSAMILYYYNIGFVEIYFILQNPPLHFIITISVL